MHVQIVRKCFQIIIYTIQLRLSIVPVNLRCERTKYISRIKRESNMLMVNMYFLTYIGM